MLSPSQLVFWLQRARTRQAQLQTAQSTRQQLIQNFDWHDRVPLAIHKNILADVNGQLGQAQRIVTQLQDLGDVYVQRGLLNSSDVSP